jgi:hypothetical protein
MPLKEFINGIDDYIILAGLLIPPIAWSIYAYLKRRYSIRSLLALVVVWSISLALLGRAFMREIIGIDA